MSLSLKRKSQITLVFLFVTLYFHYIAENNSFATVSGKLTYLAIAVLTMLLLYFWYKEDRASARLVMIVGFSMMILGLIAAFVFVF